MFIAFFVNFVQSVSKNVEKHYILTLFDEHHAKSYKKKTVFRIIGELSTNCLEKREKTLFSHTFWWTSCRELKKCFFFSQFLWTLYKVSRKTWKKHCFLILFAGHRAKSSKNAIFRIFANFVQSVSKNVKKHCFLTLFAGHRAKSSKNAVCSHFLRTLYKVSRKTEKNTVFSHFLQDIVQKAQKTLFFRIFCELCTECLEKR